MWSAYRESRIAEQAARTRDPLASTVAATYALMRGERARFEGDGEGTLRHFDRASELAGGRESIHNYLGTIFGRMGDYDRAQREFRRALEILPVSVRAWNNLALAQLLAGDRAGARASWERSLALRPNQAEALRQLEALGDR